MKRTNERGFTIIELMLTIALAGVLLAFAVPNYSIMVKNNCLTAKTNGLITAIQLARSTAITRRTDIAIAAPCTLDATAAACTDTADEFGAGVIVFRDFNSDGFPDTVVDEDLNTNGALDPGEDLNLNGVLDTNLTEVVRSSEFGCAATINETGNNVVLTYDQTGVVSPIGTFDVCDDRDGSQYEGRQVSMTTTGRATTDNEYNSCP